ncbi:MAG: hypothetical protein R3B84_00510 [Zavarzinella sp.]
MIVLKLGGSLFDLPDLAQRVIELLQHHNNEQILIVPGGGTTADVVRQWHATFQLSEVTSHWLAIRTLSLNAHLLEELLQLPVVQEIQTIAQHAILDPWDFLNCHSQEPDSLPSSWEVTSDSIAAWMALKMKADLVLVKSIPLPDNSSVDFLVRKGMIDRYFSKLIQGRQLRKFWLNLRQPPANWQWQSFGDPENSYEDH